MRVKRKGRPPKPIPVSLRMTRSTQMMLRYLARNMGMTQGKVMEIALNRLYEADDVQGE